MLLLLYQIDVGEVMVFCGHFAGSCQGEIVSLIDLLRNNRVAASQRFNA